MLHKNKKQFLPAFTLLEVMISIAVIAVLAGVVTFAATSLQKNTRDTARDSQARIITDALEKYYRVNGEYPSVAAVTSANVDTVKQKLGVSDPTIFKLPGSTTANSITTSTPSPTRMVYTANTTDTTKNTQCQTDANGYCDGYTIQYLQEANGTPKTLVSLNTTFEAVRDSETCAQGDTQDGTTCTHTYTASYVAGVYTCPSGGTLSGTTCTNVYGASYASGGGYYYCYNGGTASGTNCIVTSSYAATASGTSYACPSGYSDWPGANYPLCGQYYAASYSGGGYSCPNGGSLSGTTCTMQRPSGATRYVCPHANDSGNGFTCRHNRPAYGTKAGCNNAGYQWDGSCYNQHSGDPEPNWLACPSGWSTGSTTCSQGAAYTSATYYCTGSGTYTGGACWYNATDAIATSTYSCPSGGTLNGTTCTTSSTYPATYYTYSGYYYCSGSGTLNGTTCTQTYTGTQGAGYYTCPSGGTASGTTCSYTYQLQD